MKDFMLALHERAKAAAENFRKAELELITVLQEIEASRLFLELGYGSLFEYAVEELRLSEGNAYAFIAVARKSREIPLLQEVLREGQLTVSKLRRITPVLTPENAPAWIEKAKGMAKSALEREIAAVKPEVLAPVRSHYIAADRLHLELGVSEELMDQLVRVKDLLSQRRREDVSLEEALTEMSREYLDRHDPLRKAQRRLSQEKAPEESSANSLCPGTNLEESLNLQPFVRKALKQMVKHQVVLRDEGRCTYVHANGKRCKEQRWLEIHHRRPISEGGADTLENLTTLCFRHHRWTHEHRTLRYHHACNPEQQMLFRR